MKNTFAERLQQQMLVLYHILSIFKAGLSNIYDDWEKYLKKYLMCHIPIKILKQHAIPNWIFKRKDLFIKRVQKN